jgi:S-adenosylmethionine decarboxylase
VIRSHHFSAILTVQDSILKATAAELLGLMQAAIQTAELRAVAEASFAFQPSGISAVLLLEESHLALHLWPECRQVTVDIHICDYRQDNLPKAQKLAELLGLALTGTADSHWHYLAATA